MAQAAIAETSSTWAADRVRYAGICSRIVATTSGTTRSRSSRIARSTRCRSLTAFIVTD